MCVHNRRPPGSLASETQSNAGTLPDQPQTAKQEVPPVMAVEVVNVGTIIGSTANRWGHPSVGPDVEEG